MLAVAKTLAARGPSPCARPAVAWPLPDGVGAAQLTRLSQVFAEKLDRKGSDGLRPPKGSDRVPSSGGLSIQ